MNFHKSNVVKNAAKGQWLEILEAIAPELKDAVKNCPNHVPCPVNGGTDGFRLFQDANETGGGISNSDGPKPNGFDLLMWVLDEDFKTVLDEVADFLGINGEWRKANYQPKTSNNSARNNLSNQLDEKALSKRRHALRHVWLNSVELTSSQAKLARSYLIKRGLDLNKLDLESLNGTVQFNPGCELWHKQKFIGRFPALISIVSYPDGSAACIHRTYLDNKGDKLNLVIDGKKINAKKLMGRCENRKLSGGAIRLGGNFIVNGEFHCAEGIETALAIMQTKKVPVWSCVSALLLGLVEPPQGTTKIIAWSDKDISKKINGKEKRAGSEAAATLRTRMLERHIDVLPLFPKDDIPDGSSSVDWNDVLNQHGESGFPRKSDIDLGFM